MSVQTLDDDLCKHLMMTIRDFQRCYLANYFCMYFQDFANEMTDIKFKTGTLHISYQLNTKFPYALCGLVWETSEENLLRSILLKYISEKVPFRYVSYRSYIIDASIGKSGIVFICQETKVFDVVRKLFNAVLTTTVSNTGNYSKLSNDIMKGARLMVVGKVNPFIRSLGKDSKKIEKMKEFFNTLKIKERTSGKKQVIVYKFELAAIKRENGKDNILRFNNKNKYDMVMALNTLKYPFWFDDSGKICTIHPEALIQAIDYRYNKVLNSMKFMASSKDKASMDFVNKLYGMVYNFKPEGSDPKDSSWKLDHMKNFDMGSS